MEISLHTIVIPAELKVCIGESLLLDAGVADAEYTWSPVFGVSGVHTLRQPCQLLMGGTGNAIGQISLLIWEVPHKPATGCVRQVWEGTVYPLLLQLM